MMIQKNTVGTIDSIVFNSNLCKPPCVGRSGRNVIFSILYKLYLLRNIGIINDDGIRNK